MAERDDESATPRVVEAEITLSAAADTLAATGVARLNFSFSHLKAAEHFTEELRLHEERHQGAGWGPHFDFCRWYGTAAFVLSFSAIEAAVDEAEDDLGLPKNPALCSKRTKIIRVGDGGNP